MIMLRPKKSITSAPGFSRREFLLTVGATAPAIGLVEDKASGLPRRAPGLKGAKPAASSLPLTWALISTLLRGNSAPARRLR